MAAKVRRVFALLSLSARMDFRWFTQDTVTCALCMASDLIANIASISGIFLLAARFSGVSGLTADEVLFLLGFFTLADGLTYMLFGAYNTLNISRRIGRGQVDHMLIQPLPLWMQIVTGGFMPFSGSSGFLCGLVLMGAAAIRLGLVMTPGWILLLLVYLTARMGIALGASYAVGSAAFYRAAAYEEVSSLVNDFFNTLGKYPLTGLPVWLTGALVTVLPVGLMGWFPSLSLLQKMGAPAALWLPVAVAAVFMALGTHAFQKGMKHYVTYGCNRYRDMGHRS